MKINQLPEMKEIKIIFNKNHSLGKELIEELGEEIIVVFDEDAVCKECGAQGAYVEPGSGKFRLCYEHINGRDFIKEIQIDT